LLHYFQGFGELHVVLPHDSLRWQRVLEQQPGVRRVGRTATAVQYRLPARAAMVEPTVSGAAIQIERVAPSCGTEHTAKMFDDDPTTWWDCGMPQKGGEQLDIDLGRATPVAAVVTSLGRNVANFPRYLVVETSVDGVAWAPAWDAHVVVPVILAGMRDPKNMRVIVAFPPRDARYVRLRQTGSHDQFLWSVSELELYAASQLPPS
jgi:hypothetical protein